MALEHSAGQPAWCAGALRMDAAGVRMAAGRWLEWTGAGLRADAAGAAIAVAEHVQMVFAVKPRSVDVFGSNRTEVLYVKLEMAVVDPPDSKMMAPHVSVAYHLEVVDMPMPPASDPERLAKMQGCAAAMELVYELRKLVPEQHVAATLTRTETRRRVWAIVPDCPLGQLIRRMQLVVQNAHRGWATQLKLPEPHLAMHNVLVDFEENLFVDDEDEFDFADIPGPVRRQRSAPALSDTLFPARDQMLMCAPSYARLSLDARRGTRRLPSTPAGDIATPTRTRWCSRCATCHRPTATS